MIAKRMPEAVRHWVAASLCLVSMLLLTACGASQASTASTSTEVAATSVPSPTLTPTPTIDEFFANEAVWHFENESGYSYDMTIALGEPTRIPEDGSLAHPVDAGFSVSSACTVDPKLDIVIPAYWSAEATTVGFDTPIAMRAIFNSEGTGTYHGEYTGRGVAPFDGDDRVQVAQNFSDGPYCSGFSSTNYFGYGGSSGFNVQWDNPAAEGSVRTSAFYIIVEGYFSPATPQGDAALLDWIVLKPLSGGDLDEPAMIYRDTDGADLGFYSRKGITLSGKVVDPSAPTPTPTRTPTPVTPECTTRFGRFEIGATVVTNRDNVAVRSSRSPNGDRVVALAMGSRLTLLRGPVQVTEDTWWRIETADGQEGWVIESFLRSCT